MHEAPTLSILRKPSILARPSRCVTRKDEIAAFHGLVAREACSEQGLVAVGFAVAELTESPAARAGMLLSHALTMN